VYFFRFCPDCGAPLAHPGEPTERLVAQHCSVCGHTHYRNPKPSAGVLLVRDGRLLLGRRAIEPHFGLWDIPGGFLNPWEHPAEAATREVAEETGLTVHSLDLLTIVHDTYGDAHYVLNFYYLAQVEPGEPAPDDDVSELQWFAPEEIPTALAFASCRTAIDLWLARSATS
jgi:ADP-ribose pyrophosphatase YjhB (NUDIX family)